KKSRNNDDNNYYIADVNYERLAKFAVEVLFNEVLLGDHSQGISIVQESEIVHRIKKRVGNQTDGLKTLDISGVPEFEMINGLLEKEDLELTFMVDIPKSNGLKFYLRDDSTNKWYKFDYPIYNKEFIPLIIYTWISAYINEVPLHEAAFSQIEDKRNYLVDSIGFNDLKIETQQKSTKTDYLNINNILEDLGYDYEIMEGKQMTIQMMPVQKQSSVAEEIHVSQNMKYIFVGPRRNEQHFCFQCLKDRFQEVEMYHHYFSYSDAQSFSDYEKDIISILTEKLDANKDTP